MVETTKTAQGGQETLGLGMSRRKFIGNAATAGAAGLAASTGLFPMPALAQGGFELVTWSWLTASDGEVWSQMIQNFNDVHKDKGVQIRHEVVTGSQYMTKVLAAAASGQAPDFGWAQTGRRLQQINDGVVVPVDDLSAAAGLDWNDFQAFAVSKTKYPQHGEAKWCVPMDLMSMQLEINLDHVVDSGLDPESAPKNGAELIEWAKAMTRYDSAGNVTRSGIMMTGSDIHPSVTWGIVADQMGFARVSEDLKTACINEEAGIEAMRWVLDLFDKHKVATREVTDRYKAFATGEGSMFWTGPWTVSGYIQQGLNFKVATMPKIGKTLSTFFDMGGLEMYVQNDKSRYEPTMAAIKWLSDNSLLWTTKGRGATPRKSIAADAHYLSDAYAPRYRQAFVDGLEFATIADIPVTTSPEFAIYAGGGFLQKTLDGAWTKSKTPEQVMAELKAHWQANLDKG